MIARKCHYLPVDDYMGYLHIALLALNLVISVLLVFVILAIGGTQDKD